MATKAVKILDKNFHISLKLNDLPISVAVGILTPVASLPHSVVDFGNGLMTGLGRFSGSRSPTGV